MTFLIARRRPAVERVAGLRAAQDHAARDASRKEARSHRAVPARARRRRRSRDGRELPGARPAARCDRADRSCRRRTASMRCSRPDCPASRSCWIAPRRSGASVVPGDEVFRLYDSLGVPLDFAEDLAGQRGLVDRPRGLRDRRWRRSGNAPAPAARSSRREALSFEYASDAERRRARGRRRSASRATPTTDVPDATVVALFDDGRRQVERLETGATGFVVLDRTPFYVESGGQVSDTGQLVTPDGSRQRPSPAWRGSAPGGAARTSRHATSATHDWHEAHGARRRGRARCDAPQSHGDSPASRGAAPAARHARASGRLARRAGPAAVRLHALRRRSPTTSDAPIERVVNEQVYGNTPVEHRGAKHRGGDSRRRDGALRREVRRPRARRLDSRIQHRAVRRHARARDRRHRTVRRSPRNPASRRAFAASRR